MISRIVTLPEKQSFFLFGPRQTGKSTLVRSILPKTSWTVDLLRTEAHFKYLRDPSLFQKEASYQIRHNAVTTIFVDEVQKNPGLLDEAQSLMDTTGCQFIMTGSSARKLKRGAANLLGGRAVQRFLHPFVYPEIRTSFRLHEVLRFGSLPAVYGKDEVLKIDILKAYTDLYLKEEIQAEGIVRNLAGFSRFLEIAGASFGEMINYSNIGRECGLPARSVQGYYDILEDTLLGFRLPGWSKSKRKQLRTHPKFYFFDNGVTSSLNHFLHDEPGTFVRGRLFEQWLINEIRCRLQYAQKDYELFYWRTQAGAEVDLLITHRQEILAAIEIKASAVSANFNLSALRLFNREHPQTPLFVVCESAEPFQTQEKITILPWKLFLEEHLPAL